VNTSHSDTSRVERKQGANYWNSNRTQIDECKLVQRNNQKKELTRWVCVSFSFMLGWNVNKRPEAKRWTGKRKPEMKSNCKMRAESKVKQVLIVFKKKWKKR
jgi:hypothetical protein